MTGGCDDFICDVVGGVGNIVDGVGGAIGFAQDPFGAIFRTLRDAASGLARDVLPAITDATLPDLSLSWFIQAYAISFAAALLNAAFGARTEVLAGRMRGGEVGPFLSSLLVAQEIAGAQALFGATSRIHLVADGILAESYGAALAAAGIETTVTTPEAAFVSGVRRLAAGLAR